MANHSNGSTKDALLSSTSMILLTDPWNYSRYYRNLLLRGRVKVLNGILLLQVRLSNDLDESGSKPLQAQKLLGRSVKRRPYLSIHDRGFSRHIMFTGTGKAS
ncbi:hypothetical protein RUND412_007911 [Rhizina undulata]